ncbi:hypothetical protein IWQ62_001538 [Dispira parvispora]|uniref:Transcription initiation factor TFIID subunit 11 n=1 Tax=Dispira parvispora TaxID=1520584 RepID=A0A9W8AS52_9FUNG|nr:hypothetical protein IWQ62_001538 [Dispira parvispora]
MNSEDTAPASVANETKNDNDFVKSGDEAEEISNRKSESNQTVRVIEQSKENLLVLLDNFSEDQLDRYEAYRRSALNKTVIRRFISSVLNQPATTEIALVVAGFGKVFIGEIVELAKDVMEERGDQGPLAPVHLREAYRRRTQLIPTTFQTYRRSSTQSMKPEPDLASAEARASIRQRLTDRYAQRPTHGFQFTAPGLREAAVLLPLCQVNNRPAVLFTVRSMNLSSHQGEVSFPGGMMDPIDSTYQATCLRETREEIGITSDRIEIVGRLPPVPNKDWTIRVHPFVGIIDHGAPLDLSLLNFNKDESSTLFAMSLAQLTDPRNITYTRFRRTRHSVAEFATPEHIGPRIWGLTAFILHDFLKIIYGISNKHQTSRL